MIKQINIMHHIVEMANLYSLHHCTNFMSKLNFRKFRGHDFSYYKRLLVSNTSLYKKIEKLFGDDL